MKTRIIPSETRTTAGDAGGLSLVDATAGGPVAMTGFLEREMPTHPSFALVMAGCAAAVAIAIVGAAFAINLPMAPAGDGVSRGDRLGAPMQHQALTVEDVNSDGAVSNLVRVVAEPVTL